jgi:hypothetical protein
LVGLAGSGPVAAALSVQVSRLRCIALAEFGALGVLVGDEQDVAEPFPSGVILQHSCERLPSAAVPSPCWNVTSWPASSSL